MPSSATRFAEAADRLEARAEALGTGALDTLGTGRSTRLGTGNVRTGHGAGRGGGSAGQGAGGGRGA